MLEISGDPLIQPADSDSPLIRPDEPGEDADRCRLASCTFHQTFKFISGFSVRFLKKDPFFDWAHLQII
jgi:hypothetical protein